MDTRDGKVYLIGGPELEKAMDEALGAYLGEIPDRTLTKEEFRDKCEAEEREAMVEIDPADMTRKQQERCQISLHDHRSKLGKVLTTKRREMGFHRKR